MNIERIASLISEDPDIHNVVSESAQRGEARSSLIQYMREGNIFRPMGDIELHEALPPAIYKVGADARGAYLDLFHPVTDDLIFFEDSKMDAVLQEVSKFWDLKPNFRSLGYLHNRGILLHGPPGTGKTCLIHQITESMINGGDVVFQSSDIYSLKAILESFRTVESERRLVVVLEDMDEYIGHQERNMLQLLDGSNATDNVLFLGSTNYLDRFPPRLLRPGRFDKKIHIDYPPISGRLAYLENKLNEIEEYDVIHELAENTDGFSFGHLRELVIAGYAFKEDLNATIGRLRGVDTQSLPIREGKEPALQCRRHF